jgi:hypothetical protein
LGGSQRRRQDDGVQDDSGDLDQAESTITSPAWAMAMAVRRFGLAIADSVVSTAAL